MDVRINRLSKDYGRVTALDGVTLTIGRGLYGLLGPNGAGKSTLMKILTTLIPPTAGEVKVGPFDLAHDQQAIRSRLGYLPQEFGFHRQLTAFEVLEYAAALKGIPCAKRRAAVDQVLEQVHLTEVARRRVGGFSGGMKQRLGIAQALLAEPELLVVDEPTAGLDPEERIRFRNLLAGLGDRRTVILSTHIVGDVEASCACLAVLCRGRVQFAGPSEELTARAEGQTWDLTITQTEWQELASGLRVVRSRPVEQLVELRVLAPEKPHPSAVPAEPSLEDGYLSVVGGEDLA